MTPWLLGPGEVRRLLPQKPPFLMLDCIEAYAPHERLVARKAVTLGESHFAGHFPDVPIMPGVLVVEALAQAACALSLLDAMAWTAGTPLLAADGATPEVHVLGSLRVTFQGPVFPGSLLSLEANLVERRAAGAFFDVAASVGGGIVVKGGLTVGTMPRASLSR